MNIIYITRIIVKTYENYVLAKVVFILATLVVLLLYA